VIRLLTILATTAAAALALAGPAAAVTMTEFPIEPGAPAGSHMPSYLRPGPDGGLWFVDEAARSIGRMGLQGQRVAPIPTVASMIPHDLVIGADGITYWTQDDYGLVTRAASGELFNGRANGELPSGAAMDATGRVWWGTQDTMTPGNPTYLCKGGTDGDCYKLGPNNVRITGVAFAADGSVWVVANEQNAVWRFSPGTSTFSLRVDLPVGSAPSRIARGPDGNLWVTETAGGSVDRISPAGVLTRFPVGAGKGPNDITSGPDGALWFTETDGNAIGRITTAGQLTAFPAPTPASKPSGITTGPDGALWFTTNAAGTLVRLKLDPPATGKAPGTGVVVRDTRAPRFDRPLKVTSSRFRASKGTVFSFSLSEPAKVSLVIERSTTGRRVKGTCRTRGSENRRRPSCTLWKKVGTLSKTALQGANRVKFSGRLDGSRLAAGSYRARATAKDAAGNTSAASIVHFTITR
jgi:streptogramin lyase